MLELEEDILEYGRQRTKSRDERIGLIGRETWRNIASSVEDAKCFIEGKRLDKEYSPIFALEHPWSV
jgi:hypothetical protein